MRDLPYDAAKNDVLAGIAASSVAQKVIYKLEKTFAGTNTCLLKGKAARDALGIAYAAAVDTVSPLLSLP
ncbi:hypothetical protein EW026_g987 [Hermanssonia centrifuga]|uniref:Uncharacterized protein n=1 Tax=Hermanssonia centrifuga TaxID=98765 RepID=A0A4S4KSW9_9APHY|nr:hypothetical protein EW026_g987 [Hermanssonia centrifuga]